MVKIPAAMLTDGLAALKPSPPVSIPPTSSSIPWRASATWTGGDDPDARGIAVLQGPIDHCAGYDRLRRAG
jgi:hypothetical protein